MKKLIFTLVLVIITIGLSGCYVQGSKEAFYGISAMKDALEGRASFDLNCPKDKLDYKPIQPNNYHLVGVTGCGKKALYKKAHSGWDLEGEVSKIE